MRFCWGFLPLTLIYSLTLHKENLDIFQREAGPSVRLSLYSVRCLLKRSIVKVNCSLPQVYRWCNVFVLSVVMFVIQSAICHVFSVSKQSVDWSGTSAHNPSITYVLAMNLKCSACVFHSEQCMVQDFCQLSITIFL